MCIAHKLQSCSDCTSLFDRAMRDLSRSETYLITMPTREGESVLILTDLADTFALPFAILKSSLQWDPWRVSRFGGPTG